jgi:hypothetical protein
MFNNTHIKRSLVAAMAIGAAAFPAAAQADMFATAPGGQPPAAISAAAHHPGSSTQTGFDWADAGIGAGGAIVLVGAAAASAVATRRRRVVGVA